MPSVIEAPELLALTHTDTLPFTTVQPQALAVPQGFWHRLAQMVRRPHTHSVSHALRYNQAGCRPCETPRERLVRDYPYLYIRASSGV